MLGVYVLAFIPSRYGHDASVGLLGCQLDRLDDLRVARAAAQVAGDRLPDRLLVAVAARLEVGLRGHEHARGADAALGAAGLQERLLERAQRPRGAEALDRAHVRALHLA